MYSVIHWIHLQDHVIVKLAERSAALSPPHLHVTPQGVIGGVAVLPSVNQRKAINRDTIRTPTVRGELRLKVGHLC